MANAGMRGRSIAPLVLSAQERSYLERQVRRHRVARSLSERCRVILRCAPKIKAWLARRPHYRVHFTPTSASWINQVERWFAELTRKQIQRGVHTSVRQLEADIRTFIDLHNRNPKPFKWTKSADQILASVKRFCHKAQQTLCGEL